MAEENTTPESTPAPQTPVTPAAEPASATPAPVNMEMKMPEETVEAQPKTHRLALIAGILIILIALALGGLYLWGAMLSAERMEENAALEQAQNAETTETSAPAQSDSLDAIEAELDAQNFEAIDAELNQIDAELEGNASAQ
jgi:uncharacterized protein HemX